MVAAVNDGCRVISMSLGGFDVHGQYWWTDPITGETTKMGNDVPFYQLYKRAAAYAKAHGTVVVASAGNEGLNCTAKGQVTDYLNSEYGPLGYKFVGASFESPGSIAGVVTVSATGPGDVPASYTNYGPGFIDLAAPGGDFLRYPNGDWYTDMCLSTYGYLLPSGEYFLGYSWMAGTSMSAPKVAATVALVAVQHPDWSPQQICTYLQQVATDLGKKGKDAFYGFGFVDTYFAVGGQ